MNVFLFELIIRSQYVEYSLFEKFSSRGSVLKFWFSAFMGPIIQNGYFCDLFYT